MAGNSGPVIISTTDQGTVAHGFDFATNVGSKAIDAGVAQTGQVLDFAKYSQNNASENISQALNLVNHSLDNAQTSENLIASGAQKVIDSTNQSNANAVAALASAYRTSSGAIDNQKVVLTVVGVMALVVGIAVWRYKK